MSLAGLIQKGGLRGLATATPATFATHSTGNLPTVATVATVAVANAQEVAANDPPGTSLPARTSTATRDSFRAASLALDGEVTARVSGDPDGDCWPHSDAMNTAEIDTFTARLCRFTDKGLIVAFAETLADKLVIRDREGDDRRLCLECQHLGGYVSASWRCGARQRAAMATRAADSRLASDEVTTLRRCDGFNDQQGVHHGEE